MIGRLRELRTKQRLPGGKPFQIGCITMLHQQSSPSQSRLQGSDLFIQQDSFSLTGLIGNQSIIHPNYTAYNKMDLRGLEPRTDRL